MTLLQLPSGNRGLRRGLNRLPDESRRDETENQTYSQGNLAFVVGCGKHPTYQGGKTMKRGTCKVYKTYFRITKKASNNYIVLNVFCKTKVGNFSTLAEAKRNCN